MTAPAPHSVTPSPSALHRFLDTFHGKLALGVTTIGIPISFVVYKHVKWMDTRQDKLRMLTHQLTFWTSTAIGVGLLHAAGFWRHIPFLKFKEPAKKLGAPTRAVLALSGGVLGAAGFPMGRKLSKKLFPYPPKENEPKAPEMEIPVQASLNVVSAANIPIPPAALSPPVQTGFAGRMNVFSARGINPIVGLK